MDMLLLLDNDIKRAWNLSYMVSIVIDNLRSRLTEEGGASVLVV